MILPLRNAVTCALTTALILSSTSLLRADLDKTVRSSNEADKSRKEIETYVNGLVAKLVAKDPNSRQFRDELATQAKDTQTFSPSPSFKLIYAGAVSQAIAPLLKDEDPVVRVNAAMVVAKVAADTKAGTTLAPVAEQLINDQSIAVRVWGIKAAGALLQNLFSVQMNLQNEKISAAIAASVAKAPNSGPILQEAYKALDLTGLIPPMSPAGLCRATDRTNEILAGRVQQYLAGTPIEPQTDRVAITFLSKGEAVNAAKAAGAQGADRILKVMQNMLDITSASAERANTLSGAEKTKMLKVTEAAAGAIFVLSNANPAVDAATKDLRSASGKPVANPAAGINNILTALKALPDYKNLKNPPTIGGAGAATTQSTAAK